MTDAEAPVLAHSPSGPQWSGTGQQTIVELFDEACRRNPDKPAMQFEDGLVVTRRELHDLTAGFAGHLAERVSVGERVAVIIDNRVEFMVAYLATLANRCAFVPVNPVARAAEAELILADSGASVAIVMSAARELVESIRGSLPQLREVIVLGDDEPNGLPAGEPLALDAVACAREDIAGVYYTSGTTGAPKGCMVDHEWTLRVIDVTLRLHEFRETDRLLICLQFYYADPSLQLLRVLHCGGTAVVMRRFSVSRFWDVVRENDVTVMYTMSTMPAWLLKQPPSDADREHSVRFVIHTGISPSLHEELTTRFGFPWIENYGMQEVGLIAQMPRALEASMRGSGALGFPIPEMDVRLCDPDGQDVAVGEVGEIVVRGSSMFSGYLGNEEATTAIMRDGWLRTGDLGRADERGFLYFEGRIKDVIRRSGQNVLAAEIEQVLRSHPTIHDAAVIPVPDVDREEEIFAYVVLADGTQADDASLRTLAAFCDERLSPHKVPRYWCHHDGDFPRTPSLRVRKDQLKQGVSVAAAGVWDRSGPAG